MTTKIYSLSYTTNNHGADDKFFFGQGVIVSFDQDDIEALKDEFTAEAESHLDGGELGFEYEVIYEEVDILDPEDLAFEEFPEMARDQARLLLDAKFGELYISKSGTPFRSASVEISEQGIVADHLAGRNFTLVQPRMADGVLVFDFDGFEISSTSAALVESVAYGRFDSDGEVVEEHAFFVPRKPSGDTLTKIADHAFDICATHDLADIEEAADTVTKFVDYIGGKDKEGPTMGAMARLPDSARKYLFEVLWGTQKATEAGLVEELRKVNLSI